MKIYTKGAQSLRMKMRNAELYLKEATVIYGFQPLPTRLPNLAIVSKLERLECYCFFNSEHSPRCRRRFVSWRDPEEVRFLGEILADMHDRNFSWVNLTRKTPLISVNLRISS